MQREWSKLVRSLLLPVLHHTDVNGAIPEKALKVGCEICTEMVEMALHHSPIGLSGPVQSHSKIFVSLQGSDIMNLVFFVFYILFGHV